MLRLLGRLFWMGALLGALGEIMAIEFPTVRFPFALSRGVGFLGMDLEGGGIFPWFGWLTMVFFLLLGSFLNLPGINFSNHMSDLILGK